MKFTTSIVHNQLKHDQKLKSKVTPIYQTSAFSFGSLEELEGFYEGNAPYLYSRVGNPNTDELGTMVAKMEGAPSGIATSSGLSAILAGILSVVQAGDHIIAAEDLYGGTYHLIKEELKMFGISTSFVNFGERAEVEQAITSKTKLLYSETISNPFLGVEDVKGMVEIAKQYKLFTLIDNTFATPFLRQPYLEGIDLVAHSATKYLGGHSDITAGVLVGSENLVSKARERVVNLGANLSPFEAWLTVRGTKTLALRMAKQTENAHSLVEQLKEHNAIEKVYYPTELSNKGNGAIVTIELSQKCNIEKFFTSLQWVKIIPSLAGVETTVSHPVTTSHRALSKEAQEKIGINRHVVRISLGIEDAGDINQVFEKAIKESLEI
jgi:cystathionine beta-lyase/cystathionine gamma-synthase